MDTNKLVEKAQQGDSEAFGQLYDLYAQRMFRYIRIKVQDREDAQDILQEVFIKAYKGLGSLVGRELNFSAWLYAVTSNTVNDYLRRKYRTPMTVTIDEDIDVPSTASPAAELDLQMGLDAARAAFQELPPLYRQVLELRYFQEFTLDEIAKILKKTNLAVRLVQFRALQRVRIILKQSGAQQ